MSELKNKKVLLVITGGIAAYKALELIRLLNLHINLLTIYFFYKCLGVKFNQINKN